MTDFLFFAAEAESNEGTLTLLLYLASAVLFILGLKQLSSPRTARRGNMLASGGMLIAIVVTLIANDITSWATVIAGLVVGGGVGALLALKVKMTSMPELVAAFNGFGGVASALVALAEIERNDAAFSVETGVVVALSLLIGSITFSGSFVAFGKLNGSLPGRPILLPAGKSINALLALGAIGVSVWAIAAEEAFAYWIVVAIALVLGVLAVIPIGGADMPVVISLLNSFSGVAAAMAGFVISNSALIIGGALVGAAGMILTLLMADAMNRSIANVLFSGFGATTSSGGPIGDKPVKSATPDDVAIALTYAENVMVVPGYGLAVAQAQHAVRDLANILEDKGINVTYAIHPVAGRMPGHMNVLLAEADVPYDQLLDLDQSNPRFGQTDVVLVIGANDVVNPSARADETSPIYGMPILDVDYASTVVVIKRSLSPGFAGIDNPLFYLDNTMMLFSDGKAAVESVISAMANV
ncbi:MAG: NAD(P)(+) transhydrogenase (Re/Si-specific) subunit beta [Acidimicrobiia bacterium]|nr:NAD(P)(+) transhydrogenase (Re/Si-specific) subunit beta [Acidimicrobiia bacterium]